MAVNRNHKDKLGYTKKNRVLRSTYPYTWFFLVNGECTENNYLKEMYKFLQVKCNNLNSRWDVKPSEYNTLSLVNQVEDYSRNYPYIFDKKFVVFDKDDCIAPFDNAIKKSESKEYICLWNNESIEQWFLWHFKDVDCNHGRNWCNQELSDIFRQKGIADRYDKRDSKIFEYLWKYGNFKSAVNNAKRNEKIHEDHIKNGKYNKAVPCTQMHLLFEIIEKDMGYDIVEEQNKYKNEK